MRERAKRASAQRYHVFLFFRNVWVWLLQVTAQVICTLSTNKHSYSSDQLHVSVNAQISLHWPLLVDFYLSLKKIIILTCSTAHFSSSVASILVWRAHPLKCTNGKIYLHTCNLYIRERAKRASASKNLYILRSQNTC